MKRLATMRPAKHRCSACEFE
jgi:CRISPR/Cas system CMR-associated protein Cmr5 small subunit